MRLAALRGHSHDSTQRGVAARRRPGVALLDERRDRREEPLAPRGDVEDALDGLIERDGGRLPHSEENGRRRRRVDRGRLEERLPVVAEPLF